MTCAEFKEGLADALKVDVDWLKEDVLLAEIEGWDSLGLVGAIALLGEAGAKVNVAQIRAAKSISDLIDLAGDGVKG